MKNLKKNGGFTLVELIVVIAILAILAAVAIPAYSGYIDRTNQSLDKTLVSQVKQALELAYYTDTEGTFATQGQVILCFEEQPIISGNGYEVAVKTSFSNLDALQLKYDGWNGDFNNSSFQKIGGDELVNTVNDLTGALGDVIKNNPSIVADADSFKNYVDGMGLESSAEMSDAAVLYVAELAAGYKNNADTQTKINNLGTTLKPADNSNDAALASMQKLMNETTNMFGSSRLMGTAATYAMMMGFCEQAGYDVPDLDTSIISTGNTTEIGQMLTKAVGEITTNNSDFAAQWAKYVENHAAADMNAFVSAMSTVDSAKDQIKGQLGTGNAFSSVANLVKGYVDGGVIIIDVKVVDGVLSFTTSPDM